jgi:Protein of unknown function (DUF551)
VTQWIKITPETMPEEGKWVLTYSNAYVDSFQFSVLWWDRKEWRDCYGDSGYQPTHYMPIPPVEE